MTNQFPLAGVLTGNELVIGVQDGNDVKMPLYQALSLGTITIASVPTAFTATAADSNQIDLSWSGSADNYIVEWCRENSGAWVPIFSGSGTSFSHTELFAEEAYYYRLKAENTGEFDSDWVYVNETTPAGT